MNTKMKRGKDMGKWDGLRRLAKQWWIGSKGSNGKAVVLADFDLGSFCMDAWHNKELITEEYPQGGCWCMSDWVGR
ncbi:hypothetical protein N9L68_08410 [bacterium]|nr:hypothetical protein [bacterium]